MPRNPTPNTPMALANEALERGDAFFYCECPRHGFGEFFTDTACCVSCWEELGDAPPRHKAKTLGLPNYMDECRLHGRIEFSTTTGKCLHCFDTAGRARFLRAPFMPVGHSPVEAPRPLGRPKTESPRALARAAGAKVFMAECKGVMPGQPGHGLVEHSVAHGRCLSCYNSAGALRPLKP